MVKIRNHQLDAAIESLVMGLEYQHPLSLCGLRSEPSMNFMSAERKLRERKRDREKRIHDLRVRHGEPAPSKGAGYYEVLPTMPTWPTFLQEATDLLEAEIEIEMAPIKRDDLKCRDENGRLVEIEPKGTFWKGVAPLLQPEFEDPAEGNSNGDGAPRRVRRVERAAR